MSIVDDWGPAEGSENPMDLDRLTAEQRSSLAFLFAGVGDGKK
jgi:hypothetical protein